LNLLRINKNSILEKNILSQIHEINIKGFSSKDISLCHGHMGNLDLLLEAKEFFSLYYQRACQLVELIKKNKSNPKFLANPGLMTGAAGMVYELLRIAYPDDIPSVLTLGI
jgi:lantibiotic modifying enzyme